jgi:hypothetical protein
VLRQSRCLRLLGPSRCEFKALAHLKRPISSSYGINTSILLGHSIPHSLKMDASHTKLWTLDEFFPDPFPTTPNESKADGLKPMSSGSGRYVHAYFVEAYISYRSTTAVPYLGRSNSTTLTVAITNHLDQLQGMLLTSPPARERLIRFCQ